MYSWEKSQSCLKKAFCKVIPDYLGKDAKHCIVQHADGAGTKASLAYIYWRETGDLSVWRGVAQDAVVMNVDDLLCVGALENLVLSSSLDRNKQRIPGDVVSEIIQGTEEFLKLLRDYGLNIVSAGGETADVGDLVRTITINCTVTAGLKREEVIDNSRIKAGDVIVGLCSYGQAKYEKEYNAGMGSNGLTSARHDPCAAREPIQCFLRNSRIRGLLLKLPLPSFFGFKAASVIPIDSS